MQSTRLRRTTLRLALTALGLHASFAFAAEGEHLLTIPTSLRSARYVHLELGKAAAAPDSEDAENDEEGEESAAPQFVTAYTYTYFRSHQPTFAKVMIPVAAGQSLRVRFRARIASKLVFHDAQGTMLMYPPASESLTKGPRVAVLETLVLINQKPTLVLIDTDELLGQFPSAQLTAAPQSEFAPENAVTVDSGQELSAGDRCGLRGADRPQFSVVHEHFYNNLRHTSQLETYSETIALMGVPGSTTFSNGKVFNYTGNLQLLFKLAGIFGMPIESIKVHYLHKTATEYVINQGNAWTTWADFLVSGCYDFLNRSPQADFAENIGMEFISIPAGAFSMGSPANSSFAQTEPLHDVRMDQPFEMQQHLVTNLEWYLIMQEGGSPQGDGTQYATRECPECSFLKPSPYNHPSQCPRTYDPELQICPHSPVVRVSWISICGKIKIGQRCGDADGFVKRLQEKSTLVGYRYRLPTEAEMEYATRGGTTGPYWFDETPGTGQFDQAVWHAGNSRGYPHVVTEHNLTPNPFGLVDIVGNLAQWVEDFYHPEYGLESQFFLGAVAADPVNNYIFLPSDESPYSEPKTNARRVVKGGGFTDDKLESFRSAARVGAWPESFHEKIGFRLVRVRER